MCKNKQDAQIGKGGTIKGRWEKVGQIVVSQCKANLL